jgi:hypothetical protein
MEYLLCFFIYLYFPRHKFMMYHRMKMSCILFRFWWICKENKKKWICFLVRLKQIKTIFHATFTIGFFLCLIFYTGAVYSKLDMVENKLNQTTWHCRKKFILSYVQVQMERLTHIEVSFEEGFILCEKKNQKWSYLLRQCENFLYFT